MMFDGGWWETWLGLLLFLLAILAMAALAW